MYRLPENVEAIIQVVGRVKVLNHDIYAAPTAILYILAHLKVVDSQTPSTKSFKKSFLLLLNVERYNLKTKY